jgi:tripartite motif-containing protein 71
MNDLNLSRNQAVRPRAKWFLALFLLAIATPLHAQNPPTYLFQIDSSAVPGGFAPYGVALDGSNDVYVADYGNNRIVKFDRDGNYLTQWGSSGTNNGQFAYPQGIAVDSSYNVYVTDSDNRRVEKFDRNGNYLTQWGSVGSGNGQFDYPEGVAVDTSNNVYVADEGDNRVEKFSSSGTYLAQWGSYGSGNGQLYGPVGIAVDTSNHVYVADYGNNRVEKFDGNGNYLTQWGSFWAEGIAVDTSNNVYVAGTVNDGIEKFDSSGNYLTQWGSFGIGNGQFDESEGIAVDRTGNDIYVADFGNGRIQVFVNSVNLLPPFITQQPGDQTVPAGRNGTFSIALNGATPFSCQWNSNNVAVPGATNATFTLTNVSLSASGSTYSVLVTNSFGSVLSSNAVLTVLPAADFITPTYLFQIDSSALPADLNPIPWRWMAATMFMRPTLATTALRSSMTMAII